MAFLGDLDLANKWSVLGLELNPLHPDYYFGYLASIKYLSGSYDEAIGFVKQCPDAFPETRVWAAVSHACLGQHGQARDAFSKFLSDVGRRWEGASLPTEDAILGWLSRAVPLTWEEGQSKFNSDLAVARGNAPPERISGTS